MRGLVALKIHVYRQLRASVFALLTTIGLTATLALTLGKSDLPEPRDPTPRRWPEMVQPPPPSEPTARAEAQGQRAQGVSLSTLDTPDIKLQLDTAAVDTDLVAQPRLGDGLGEGLPDVGLGGLELGRHGDAVFNLNELDRQPMVVYRPRYQIPKVLLEAGISDTTVKVHVMIHEDGRLSLIHYEHLPYPELKPEVERIIRKMRYTSPEKNGRPVKAEFLLPLNLEGV